MVGVLVPLHMALACTGELCFHDHKEQAHIYIYSLTGNLVWKYRRLLVKSRAKLFSFGNFQIGQKVKDWRGKHSSAFYKGTSECMHQVNEYNDTMFGSRMNVDVIGVDIKCFYKVLVGQIQNMHG